MDDHGPLGDGPSTEALRPTSNGAGPHGRPEPAPGSIFERNRGAETMADRFAKAKKAGLDQEQTAALEALQRELGAEVVEVQLFEPRPDPRRHTR